ncbi:sigma-70 family RNA polymerase sigma factor [Monashia sp. NPDC004114]
MTIIDETPTDSDLVARVRAGDTEAYGELWSRHVDVARGLARRITSRDPDDLIGESYARILTAIQAGRGPDTAFRPYLLSTIRRVNIDNARRYQTRVVPTDSPEVLDPRSSESSEDIAMRNADGSSAIAAWQSLPAETRDLLWELVVMDETPARLSGKLGMSPNAVASRARRARERLRQAYLSQLVTSNADDECRLIRSDLGAYVRGSLGATRRETIDEHLESCGPCRNAVADLRSVDDMIKLRVAPFLPIVALGAAHELVSGAGALSAVTQKALAVVRPQLARVTALNGPTGFVAAASSLAAAVGITAVLLTGGHDVPATAARHPAPVASSVSNADRARAATPVASPVALVSAGPAHVPIAKPHPVGATAVHAVNPRPAGPPTHTPSGVPSLVPSTVPHVAPSRPAPSPAPSPTPTVTEPPKPSPGPPATQPIPTASDQDDHDDDDNGDEQTEQSGQQNAPDPVPPAAPSGPVTVVLASNATSPTLTMLRVTEGWMITAVSTLSDHPSNRSSHFPTRSFVGFVRPGQIIVAVSRTSSARSSGSLDYDIVDRGGRLERGRQSLS